MHNREQNKVFLTFAEQNFRLNKVDQRRTTQNKGTPNPKVGSQVMMPQPNCTSRKAGLETENVIAHTLVANVFYICLSGLSVSNVLLDREHTRKDSRWPSEKTPVSVSFGPGLGDEIPH